jgi:aromatic-L-amino-acid decarboxylase
VLDPADWEAFRALAHRALDDAVDHLRDVRSRPAWRPVPEDVREALAEPMPLDPTPLEHIYERFVREILPYGSGNIHPRFFGWVQGSGTPTGALADLLAATMNPNVGGRNHVAVHVERAVIAWFRDLFGFPREAGGVMTVGTSAANLIAVVVARTRALGAGARDLGLQQQRPMLAGYASRSTHGCVRKAFEISGLGSRALRVLPVDGRHRLDVDALREAIARDRAAGIQPFLLVGNAGTVDVGAVDPLETLADVAAAEGLWFHVDGAFGAPGILAPSLKPLLKGLERADSLAFDFHKWLHVPYDAGCVIVRDGELHRAAFASEGPYLTRMDRGLASATPWFTDFGIDLSRAFRALKVWFTVHEHGARKLGEVIEANVRQAHALGALVAAHPRFELLVPVQTNVVCFRYRPDGLAEAAADHFNDELVIRVQESGDAVVSATTVGGRRAIRACFVNQRTRDEDVPLLLATIEREAEALLGARR